MGNKFERLKQFEFRGESRKVRFIETMKVREGVECDVYEFVDNKDEDLGIIRVDEGKATPLQKVTLDPKIEIVFTEEGYVSGCGSLEIQSINTQSRIYKVNSLTDKFSVCVERGERMKWKAGKSGLVAYEICNPPYREGRFENLD